MRAVSRRLSAAAEKASCAQAVALAREGNFRAALGLIEVAKAAQREREARLAYTRSLRLERVCRLGVGDKPGLRDVLTELFLLAGEEHSEGATLTAARNLARAHFDCGEAAAVLALSERYPAVLRRHGFSDLFARGMRLLGAEARLMLGQSAEAEREFAAIADTEFDLDTSAELVANHAVSAMLSRAEEKLEALSQKLREAIMLGELAAFEPLLGPVHQPRQIIAAARAESRELTVRESSLQNKSAASTDLSVARTMTPTSPEPVSGPLAADLQANYARRDQMLAVLAAPKLSADAMALKLRNPRSIPAVAALTRLYLEAGDPQQTFRWCNAGLVSSRALGQLDAAPFFLYIAFLMFSKAGLRARAEENLRFCIEAAAAREAEHLKLGVLSFLEMLKGEGRWFELYQLEHQLREGAPWPEGVEALRQVDPVKIARPMFALPHFVFK